MVEHVSRLGIAVTHRELALDINVMTSDGSYLELRLTEPKARHLLFRLGPAWAELEYALILADQGAGQKLAEAQRLVTAAYSDYWRATGVSIKYADETEPQKSV